MQKAGVYMTTSEVNRYIKNDIKSIKSNFDIVSSLNSENDDINQMLAIDYKTYMLDNILTKIDRATMSVSLEGREPLLDYRIIEFAAQLPSKYKYSEKSKKYILKEIAHKYLPKDLMDRPKMGFSMPLNEWFGDELKVYINEYLDSYKIKEVSVLNTKEVENLKIKWLRDGKDTSKIWLILVYMMWWEKWMK